METLASYLEALASASPVPGGGSAAAVVAACGAALIAMVARIVLGNPKYASKHEAAHAIVEQADALRALLLAGRELDEAAYAAVVAATAMPRDTAEQKAAREAALQKALRRAASVPLEAASLSLSVLLLAETCSKLGNKHLMSDVRCAAAFARAGFAAASYNVRTNHAYLKDATLIAAQEGRLAEMKKQADGAPKARASQATLPATSRIISPPVSPTSGMLVLYVDESGEHEMLKINPDFPVLTLAGCVFNMKEYEIFQHALRDFKSNILNKPDACIHSRDIRKWEGDFSHILSDVDRKNVIEKLSEIIASARFTLITVTIVKDRLNATYASPAAPYELAVRYLIERFHKLLKATNCIGAIHAEARGKKQDNVVDAVYSSIKTKGFLKMDGQTYFATAIELQKRLPGRMTFGLKKHNCAGLELADLAAYPIARHIMNPDAHNQAFDILKPKLYAGGRETLDFRIEESPAGWVECGSLLSDPTYYMQKVRSYGLKIFP